MASCAFLNDTKGNENGVSENFAIGKKIIRNKFLEHYKIPIYSSTRRHYEKLIRVFHSPGNPCGVQQLNAIDSSAK